MSERKPYFLIRGMSPELRQLLEIDAQDEQLPIQEILRRILCAHYDLDCPRIEGLKREDVWKRGTLTVQLKMSWELFNAIREDSEETGESRISLVLQALEGHYAAKEAA